MNPRQLWLDTLTAITRPVLANMAVGRLRQTIPAAAGQRPDRVPFNAMEAFCRSLAGLAPWLAAPALPSAEAARRDQLLALARQALTHAVNPQSPDYLDFTASGQPQVEIAYLALGLLRAHPVLWNTLTATTRRRLIHTLTATRAHHPPFNNWLLFAATVEACLCKLGAPHDPMRIDYAIRQHDQWYQGDGAYGDGPYFHWDYYNSYVIHPMLRECLDSIATTPLGADLRKFQEPMRRRARRYAEVQEHLIAPDGTFPPLGRSIIYRLGAFHHLAHQAWRQDLPPTLPPAQVRCALTAVLRQTMLAPGTINAGGWLTLGLHGAQTGLADPYNCAGSPYLAVCGFLPLGLPPQAPFWRAPDRDWTAKKIWSGHNHPGDHCLDDRPDRCLCKS
ncbi:MAG: DUF2264 domain-containing protein [Verrucomicrobiales bacterium]|jgi:hypothetical protein|nr:DUF2264 domain-containing protein [Verrucomicrobiales bacterium]